MAPCSGVTVGCQAGRANGALLMSQSGDSYTLELNQHELAAVSFFVGERRWRAHNAIHSGELPIPEASAFRAEIRRLDDIDAKIAAAKASHLDKSDS